LTADLIACIIASTLAGGQPVRVTNTTGLKREFLRRMTVWCAKQIGLPLEKVAQADFRNRSGFGARGTAWRSGRIMVRFTKHTEGYPITRKNHRGTDLYFRDQLANVVYLTAHELTHLMNWHDGTDAQLRRERDLEPYCVRSGNRVMKLFEEQREELVAAWSAAIPARKAAKPPKDPVALRAAKARLDLARWERKLKFAKTKVAKYRAKVKRYAKRGLVPAEVKS
jgi:hypothetical protein